MFSFNINTSAKEAKNIVEEFEERNEYDLEEIKENVKKLHTFF